MCLSEVVLAAALLQPGALTSRAEADSTHPRPISERQPTTPDAAPRFDASDQLATLEAIHLALSEVGDGSSYVWHRRNGHLSGVVQPTASFVDRANRVCRHLVLVLSAGAYSRRTEGVACRLVSGVWQLEG